ncbi:MAG TPA: hypothetical protein PLS50_00050 [Candidatus Dojkabacteria bacterium]|nr:hypothetical protein [Candidatus Dojkabacteria bacterium]
MQEFTIGCDPELFLQHKTSNEYVSAWGMFPGTKDKPFKVDKGAVQVDGFALEFNIEPAKTALEFDNNISTVIKQMEDMVHKADSSLKLSYVPYADFKKEYFDSLPEENKILGCDPDFNSITGTANVINEDVKDRPYRTAAGHMHLGWTKDEDVFDPVHFQDCKYVANYFYNRGSNPLGLMHPDYDHQLENLRFKMYGRDGAFRPKSYGVELRMYSNHWVPKSGNRIRMFNFISSQLKEIYKG